MTEFDPIRWTESSDDAPELLRAPFAAACREGPSAAQMRILAVKLAAVAAGTAVTAGAATAQASTTASSTLTGGAIAASTLPLAKIVAAVLVVGATAWGGLAFFNQPAQPTTQAVVTQAVQTVRAPSLVAAGPKNAALNVELPATTGTGSETRVQPLADGVQAPSQPTVRSALADESSAAKKLTPARTATPKSHVLRNSDATRTGNAGQATQEAHDGHGKVGVPSEVELLRRARAALAARPREAFAMTEQHREHYPSGVFAQERDAIAIEALLRAGDTDAARSLAKRFVSSHPSSPHAHRFRETLGLH